RGRNRAPRAKRQCRYRGLRQLCWRQAGTLRPHRSASRAGRAAGRLVEPVARGSDRALGGAVGIVAGASSRAPMRLFAVVVALAERAVGDAVEAACALFLLTRPRGLLALAMQALRAFP